jgi:hypothetical protein
MSCVKILNKNYVSLDILANSDVSSEQAAFPVVNAYSKYRRSKVWRSAGYYKVDATNNTIIFRDDTTTNKTATIAIGEYTSHATFMAAVDAALEAVGVSNYTVTQNSNFKFVIASDLSGGATAFQLRVEHISFTAEELLGFDDSAALTGASSYTADYLRINSPNEWILWDMGVSTNPQHFVLIGSRNRAIKISPNAVIKLQGSHTNNFASAPYEQTITYNDEAMYLFSATGLHTQALRYWRLSIEDQNPNGYIEVGGFFLGNQIEFERGAAGFPLNSSFVDRSETIFSEGGQSYSEIRPQSQSFQLQWNGLTKNDLEEITQFFREYGTGNPFYISIDSQAAFTPTANKMIKYVKFQNVPSWNLVSPNNYSCSMDIREEL